MERLSLKDKPFKTFEPAKQEEIDALWNLCVQVDKGLKVLFIKRVWELKIVSGRCNQFNNNTSEMDLV
jgi:hypothetical protein